MYAHEGGFAVFGRRDVSSVSNGKYTYRLTTPVADGLQKSIKDGSRNVDISLGFRPIVDEGTVLALLTNSNPETTRLTIEIKRDKVGELY